MTEKITVLMPVYNREKFIGRAIRSILDQTYENLRLIIYDDGSTDNTAKIVNDFMEDDKPIEIYIGKDNKGVAYARNFLLDMTDTRYACWQDSDDMSNKYRLQMLCDHISRNDLPIVYSGYHIFNADKFQKLVVNQEWWMEFPTIFGEDKRGNATAMFRVNAVGDFDESKKLGDEDTLWLDDIEKRNGIKFSAPYFIRNVLYYICFHKDRIGIWKRKLKHIKGTDLERTMTYEQMIRSFHAS